MNLAKSLTTLNMALASAAALAGAETPPEDRIRAADEKYAALFAAERTPSATDPEFMNILQHFIFGEVFRIGELDDATRELITVVSLTTLQALPQLKAHVAAAMNAGCSPLEIREAVYLCAPIIGFPRTLNAVAVFNEVMKEKGVALPLEDAATVSEGNRRAEGARIQNALYGDEVQKSMRNLPGIYEDAVPDMLTDLCFGDFYTRAGLSVRRRELLSLVALTALGAEKQLKAHVVGNLRAGNGKETMLAAMVQAATYVGLPNALTAIAVIKDAEIENYAPIYGE